MKMMIPTSNNGDGGQSPVAWSYERYDGVAVLLPNGVSMV